MIALLLALLSSAFATITVSASIESYATVEVDSDCARLVTNDPDAIAWVEDQPLVANADWLCPLDPDPPAAMYAHLVRLR